MTKLPAETWARFGIWLALGAVIYVVFGYRNSRLRRAA
jgi:APA family basic amino acid/polyamine antiporter